MWRKLPKKKKGTELYIEEKGISDLLDRVHSPPPPPSLLSSRRCIVYVQHERASTREGKAESWRDERERERRRDDAGHGQGEGEGEGEA